jgi:hypothetical protein
MWTSLTASVYEQRDESLLDIGRAKYHERSRPPWSSAELWHTLITIRAESSGRVELTTIEDTTGLFESLPSGRFTFERDTRSVTNIESATDDIDIPKHGAIPCMIWPPRIESLMRVVGQSEDGPFVNYVGGVSGELVRTCPPFVVLGVDLIRATIDTRWSLLTSWEASIEGNVAMLAQLRDITVS